MQVEKRMIALGIGLLPFLAGYMLETLALAQPDAMLPYKLIALICLLLWALAGWALCGKAPISKVSAAVHGPAFLVLALLICQELISGHYWHNALGILTQLYYLPVLALTHMLTAWTHVLWPAYMSAFLLMYAAFYAGGCWRKRRQKGAAAKA